MKKSSKILKRIFAMILCVLTIVCVGCSQDTTGSLDDDILKTKALDGAKVLSKPEDYSFESALGEFSVNYYNLFSRNVLYYLYNIYEDPYAFVNGEYSTVAENLFSEIVGEEFTYSGLLNGEDDRRFYLYDSLRYTISYTNLLSGNQTVGVDFSSAWNWTLPADAGNGKGTIFHNIQESENTIVSVNGNNVTITGPTFEGLYGIFADKVPSFEEIYAGDEVSKGEGSEIKDFYTSPFESYGGTGQNFFQDALEYATYLIVLGYDYQAYSADAPYFDFTVEYKRDGGKVVGISDIKVGGWENQKISVSQGEDCALARVKDAYQKMGAYIGLTEKNRQQLAKFIKDKVIGEKAYAKNKFTVKKSAEGQPNETISFNRNYDLMIDRVISYACEQVPIGKDKEGNDLKLDSSYMASQIMDFEGDYFFPNYTWQGEDDDQHILRDIEPAEYQSLVIFPQLVDILKGNALSEVSLVLEYWDDPEDAYSAPASKQFASEITVNIGARFYDHSENKIYDFGAVSRVIPYGKYSTMGDNPDAYCFWFSTSEEAGEALINPPAYGLTDGYFNNDIGDKSINAFASGLEITTGRSAIVMSGAGRAKDYYKTNPSSTYGTYGTLNEAMFAGSDGCDFFEVYFDIDKEKGNTDVNYNFKVALNYVGYDEMG